MKTDRASGKILVVDFRIPAPDQDSGSASTFAYLRILARAGYKLTFIPQRMNGDERYVLDLNGLGIETPGPPEWTSLEAAVEAFVPNADVALLYRAPVAAQVFDIVRRAAPAARIVFHPVDLHFMRMSREAALAGDEASKESANAMRVLELSLIKRADAVIVVSTVERDLLRELLPDSTVHQIPILRATPSPRQSPRFENRRDILFIGTYKHLPNVDGLMWFVRDVWPRLLALGFTDRLVIAGSFVTKEIEELSSAEIVVRGHVPDLATVFDGVRLSVAPLRFGAGVKGKIVSSLSLGLPVVATAIAVEGMGLRHGVDALIASGADEMARQIIELYTSPTLWQTLASNGCQTFQQSYSETAVETRLLSIFDSLLSQPR